jgi:hypothetical protein
MFHAVVKTSQIFPYMTQINAVILLHQIKFKSIRYLPNVLRLNALTSRALSTSRYDFPFLFSLHMSKFNIHENPLQPITICHKPGSTPLLLSYNTDRNGVKIDQWSTIFLHVGTPCFQESVRQTGRVLVFCLPDLPSC